MTSSGKIFLSSSKLKVNRDDQKSLWVTSSGKIFYLSSSKLKVNRDDQESVGDKFRLVENESKLTKSLEQAPFLMLKIHVHVRGLGTEVICFKFS